MILPATLNFHVAALTAFGSPQFNGLLSSFTQFITKEKLYDATLLFLSITAAMVIATYVYLFIKKRTFFYKEHIRQQLDTWISKAILEELEEDENGEVVPAKFKGLVANPIARQFAIDELVSTKRSLTGEAANNIVKLYLELGLKESSLKKMDSKKWHVKAKGIQELYMMEQKDLLTKIYRQTNSKNEFVRMEAQTGIIHLAGFKGLRFLDIVTYPITDWQQLKLLEQLSQAPFAEMKNLEKWLQSTNPTVIVFALRIIEAYQQFQVHDEVAKRLDHEVEAVRMQAVKTITSIAEDATPKLLAIAFHKDKFTNKLNILEHLVGIATQEQFDFLLELQEHPNDLIKLKAAIVLARCSPMGIKILEKKGQEQPEPFQKIFLHVQSAIRA